MPKVDQRKAQAAQIAAKTTENYGHRTGFTATDLGKIAVKSTSTGIPMLDYVTGIGGWPSGFGVEVFGIPDIGKSAIFGLNGIREAQRAGKLCGLIAMEPSFDTSWAVKHGVDPDLLVVAYPNDGEEAFGILYEWAEEGVPDFIVFDSIGGIPAKTKEAGGVKAFGASGVVSAGVTNVAPLLWKNEISVLYLNQVRDDTQARIPGLLDSPGGWALRHVCPLRIQVKPGKDKYTEKVGKGDLRSDLVIGRRVVATIKRNKLTEISGPGTKAQFDSFHRHSDDHVFGIDQVPNLIETGLLSGVVTKSGGWLNHDIFPKGKVNGVERARTFFDYEPEAYDKVYGEIIDKMTEQVGAITKPTLEEVSDGV